MTTHTRAKESLKALELISRIEDKAKGRTEFVCVVLLSAIKDGIPATEILATIASQAEDNRPALDRLLGSDLVEDIIQFVKNNRDETKGL